MKKLLNIYTIFAFIMLIIIHTYYIARGDCKTGKIQKTIKEIRQIYKHDDSLYLRLSNEEKKNMKKKMYKDNSLEIYLK